MNRKESDSLGEIDVPQDRYWGAQTARSLIHFNIGQDLMPLSIIYAIALIKKIAARVNIAHGLSKEKADLIIKAANEIIEGKLDDHFPLKVWQTGSGTQTNMNVNEVIANRANERCLQQSAQNLSIHPNDDVNRSQSSNDVFPTAMHIVVAEKVLHRLLPVLRAMHAALNNKAAQFKDIIKIGRTHLMDAVPMTLGQEFSGYAEQIEQDIQRIESTLPKIYELAIGGTAIGTGLNAPAGFSEQMVKGIALETKLPFVSAPNKFAALAAHDALVFTSGSLKTLCCSLLKIANDIRWMGSGPRCGLSELILPANEPGSSIMPGKVNPTQCEAIMMVAVQVIGYDTAITYAGSMGNFELNVFKPLIIFNIVHSIDLLTDAGDHFTRWLIDGIKPNVKKIAEYVDQSLMLVTALTPKIGYDKAAELAHYAFKHGLSLKEACLALRFISEDEFDQLVQPQKMVRP